MSELLHNAFHFDSLVWHGPIAVYLFLLGLSAGSAMLGVMLKRRVVIGPAWENGFIRAIAVIAPLAIFVSLAILIMHLTKPLMFWKLMFNYNLSSVMSLGVIGFQLYTVALLLWLALVFETPLMAIVNWLANRGLSWLTPVATWIFRRLQPLNAFLEWSVILLALALSVYTGFLLSALKTYPMLDNPWLPILFLFSGLSSGAAGTLLLGVTLFGEPVNSRAAHWLHTIERPVVWLEVLALTVFLGWLWWLGGRSEIALLAAIGGGFWAVVFWVGVVGIGLATPITLSSVAPAVIQHRMLFVVTMAACTLTGVIALRYFILYAGQLTVY